MKTFCRWLSIVFAVGPVVYLSYENIKQAPWTSCIMAMLILIVVIAWLFFVFYALWGDSFVRMFKEGMRPYD